ncbi:glycine/D-amino acid oxidase-like deaminating enzyme [Azospirillum agricola]|uniref:NAD(P)/FAD-dependent oxidoreductase n=1 Tax=Azospirillum agricola TaxID=1720247 RepID=UPI001AE5D48B|nr:FAD-dependent oxidoreductase [Azospirillum agricola]MBP2231223.1 glycine/D-amino acid oxidase-like deaminating enzyme [Azospirillum agricola]
MSQTTQDVADREGGQRPGQGGIWRKPDSLWEATAPPAPALPVLRDHAQADLLVIGGGFTGLSAALHAAEAGRRVVVLEASELGRGASGRNNGQVIPTLTRPDPDDMVARFGGEAGERFVALVRDSAADLFDLIRRLGIDCAAEQTGWVQPVHSPGRIRIAERRVEQWGRRGAPVELLDRAAVSTLLGTDAYFGGWINRSGGHINPLALVRGLAARAVAAGAAIHVNSPALSVERQNDCWVARTPQGAVTADRLILGTNGYAAAVFPEIRTEVVPVLSWQMATAPLDESVRRAILPGRQAMSDTHGDLRFMRHTADGRLVSGGALLIPVNGPDRLRHIVGERLAGMFPALRGVAFDHVWNGRIAMTTDYFPRVHRLGPNGFAWAGCNGRGVALSVALGREMARAALGRDPAELALPFTPPTPLPFNELLQRVGPLKLLQYRWNDSREIA